MNAVQLAAYAEALSEEFADDGDTLAVLRRLERSRRGEYEAKVPELGDLIHLVREFRGARRRAEEERRQRAEDAVFVAYAKAHPEEFVTMDEVAEEWQKMRGGARG